MVKVVKGIDVLELRDCISIIEKYLDSPQRKYFLSDVQDSRYLSVLKGSNSELFLSHIGFVLGERYLSWDKKKDDSGLMDWIDEIVDILDSFEGQFFSDVQLRYLGGITDYDDFDIGEDDIIEDSRIVASARYDVGFVSVVGRRADNEDEIVVLGMGPKMRTNEDFFAIYDGHGGYSTSRYLSYNLHYLLGMNRIIDRNTIHETFVETNEKVFLNVKNKISGSTAVIVYIIDNIIHVANCGDSRAVLGMRESAAQRITVDHKPDSKKEWDRIRSLGGRVDKIAGVARVQGNLSTSRSFGDIDLKPFVIPDPFVQQIEITDNLNFIILACDGLWDVLSDQEAVDIVSQSDNPKKASEALSSEALLQGSTDNISIIVVFLKPPNSW